jgi:hypothetical protein
LQNLDVRIIKRDIFHKELIFDKREVVEIDLEPFKTREYRFSVSFKKIKIVDAKCPGEIIKSDFVNCQISSNKFPAVFNNIPFGNAWCSK